MINFYKTSIVLGAALLLVQPVFAAEVLEEEVDPNGPWMICEIDVTGLRNISKSTVTKAANAKKGTLYERYTVSDDIHDISALGNFDKVEVDISRISGTKKDKQFSKKYGYHACPFTAIPLNDPRHK